MARCYATPRWWWVSSSPLGTDGCCGGSELEDCALGRGFSRGMRGVQGLHFTGAAGGWEVESPE